MVQYYPVVVISDVLEGVVHKDIIEVVYLGRHQLRSQHLDTHQHQATDLWMLKVIFSFLERVRRKYDLMMI